MRHTVEIYFDCIIVCFCLVALYFGVPYGLFYSQIGPFTTNGVPLRRVNQRYVIATSTKVSLAGVNTDKIDDAMFAREATSAKKDVLATEKPANTISAERKAAQTAVDAALTKNLTDSMMTAYLKAKFSLKNGDKPHSMKF